MEANGILKIALACGGTGGHVIPGLATAEVLRQRGHDITLWLTGRDVESEAVKTWPGPKITVPAEGFPRGVSIGALRSLCKIWRAGRRCKKLMKHNKPSVLLAMGSYASAGPVLAALSLKVPYVMHEANVLPGRAVSLFSRWAAAVGISFEETRFYLPRRNLEVTGMPLRHGMGVSDGSADGLDRLDRGRFTILVMGGSRGARHLNDIASQAIRSIWKKGCSIQVIHLTGAEDEQRIRSYYETEGIPHTVHAFTHDMRSIYRMTDLAICRSGASTCAELMAFGVSSLLVPYPFAANDHQMVNARAMEKMGGADVVPERDISVGWLVDYLTGCVDNPKRLARMSAALKAPVDGPSAERLADLVERVGRGSLDRASSR